MMKFKNWKMAAVLVIATFFIAMGVSYVSIFHQLELKMTDQLFKLRGRIAVEDSPLVLVSISQSADSEIPYKYPWPTRYYAKLVENLNKAGARAIGFDVIFDKVDSYGPENDSLFARTLQKYGNVVLAGSVQNDRQYRGSGTRSFSSMLVEANDELRTANSNPAGLVNMVKDPDDKIRQYPLFLNYNNRRYYSLGLELLRIYQGWEELQPENNEKYLTFGSYRIPKSGRQTMNINYFSGPSSFQTHSFEMVIDDTTITLVSEEKAFPSNSFSDPDYGLLANKVFKDKIVLVGATMPSLNDYHSTPFAEDGSMPGYEIHANAIQTILTGRYLHYPPFGVDMLMVFVISLVVVLTLRRSSVRFAFIQFLGLSAAIVAGIIIAFLQFNYILPATGPLAAVLVGYLGTLSHNYITEQREKRRIQLMFSTYVSPRIVEKMIESGNTPHLGGDEAHITAYFTDIASFSRFSEQIEPRDMVELINEYLSAMTAILTEHEGTLDKYVGDAIIAFFGAPVACRDHAYKACIVSQLMQLRLSELRKKWKNEGDKWPALVHNMRMRIGINSGKMLTGNMGSESRFNYTMMGDNVNLAARCESGAKHYGVFTLVTEQTKKEARQFGDECVFRYLDHIVVKGRTSPLNVYELMGLREHLTGKDFDCKRLFETGVQAYQNREWDKAAAIFEKSAKLEMYAPGDDRFLTTNPSLVYLKRCKLMKEDPPGDDWSGVHVMQEK